MHRTNSLSHKHEKGEGLLYGKKEKAGHIQRVLIINGKTGEEIFYRALFHGFAKAYDNEILTGPEYACLAYFKYHPSEV